ncbi:hypothetical protein Hanom_Chr12g01141701 [Helianthus anomalus]
MFAKTLMSPITDLTCLTASIMLPANHNQNNMQLLLKPISHIPHNYNRESKTYSSIRIRGEMKV